MKNDTARQVLAWTIVLSVVAFTGAGCGLFLWSLISAGVTCLERAAG